MKIIEANAQAAMAVLQHYTKTYGTTGAESMQRMAVLSIYACITGNPAAVATDFKGVVGQHVLADPYAPDEKPVEGVLLSQEEHDRNMAILGGLIFDSMERNLTITADAALVIRGGGDFPEPGIFVPFTMATAMVEKVMKDAGDPDTIIGKHVRESIAAETLDLSGINTETDDADDSDEEDDSEDFDFDDDAADAADAANEERKRGYTEQLQLRTKNQLQSIAADCGVKLESGLNKQDMIEAILDASDLDFDVLTASLGNHPPQ